jgi:integrase
LQNINQRDKLDYTTCRRYRYASTNEAKWIESRQRWQINVQRDGERRTFTDPTPGKKGKAAAERKAEKWLTDKYSSSRIRFGKLWEDFLNETKVVIGETSYIYHESIGRMWLLPVLKNKRADAITVQNWQDCINIAAKAGRSKKTSKNIRGSMTAVCRYAKKRRIAIQYPEDITIPRDAPVGQRKILQPSDLKTLFDVDHITRYNKPEQCFYIHAWRFIVLTGLRRGELCGLKNPDIDGDIVHIRRSVNKRGVETQGKTEAATRYFVLSRLAKAVLDDQRQMPKANGIISEYVFPDEYAGRTEPSRLYKKWSTYSKRHGFKCSLHEIRHTLISVAKADVPEELLKRAVGHTKSTDTFGIYGHDVEGEMKRVADILDDTFSKLLK